MQPGDLDGARADFDKAAEIDPSNFYAYWNRGAVYAANGDFGRARADFSKALALNPDTASKARIEEALNAIDRNASEAKAEPPDPSVITDPSRFGGELQDGASAAQSFPTDAMPSFPSAIQAAPPVAASPPMLPPSPAQ
ncbi:MAG: tetratricopeptide repeat protein [Methyloceanibacter sp.]